MAISQKLRFFIVVLRDRNRCRRCGRTVDILNYSIHHRQPRGMGGRKNADHKSNLVLLCGSGVDGCHGWVEQNRTEAVALGWLVLRNSQDDPEQIPMVDLAGRQFFLDDLGGVKYVTTGVSS